jgi:environmental stress-induced protein Ves
MKLKHYSNGKFAPKRWKGGTTTQLYIFPENASYEKGDFHFRISTATVESDESTFTRLPGVSRTLLLLSGKMKLVHKDIHSKNLEPFEQDKFLGDWQTKSFGQCVDFNLMTKGTAHGEINVIELLDKKELSLPLKTDCHYMLYLFEGEISYQHNQTDIPAYPGDLIYLTESNLLKINSKAQKNVTVILVSVYL